MQQGDADAVANGLCVRVSGGGGVGVFLAETAFVDAVDGDLVLRDEVSLDRGGHGLRGGHAAAAVALDLDDVTLFVGKLEGELVQVRLGGGAERGVTGGEGERDRADGLVLIEVLDGAVEGGSAVARIRSDTIRGVCAAGGVGCVLIGEGGGGVGLGDASLCATVHILDVIGVLALELVELVRAVTDGIELTLYPLFAGKRVDVTPEAFLGTAARAACRWRRCWNLPGWAARRWCW